MKPFVIQVAHFYWLKKKNCSLLNSFQCFLSLTLSIFMDIEHCFSNLTTELLPLKSFLVCTINIFPIRSQTGPKYTEQWSVLLYKAVSFVAIGRQKDVDVRENKAFFFFFFFCSALCTYYNYSYKAKGRHH